jgi:hypothetical protein
VGLGFILSDDSRPLLHQQHRSSAFDFARDLPVHVRRHAGNSAREDFAAFGNELLKKIRILVVDRLRRDVDAAAGHDAICPAEIRSAFGGFWFHVLFRLPM